MLTKYEISSNVFAVNSIRDKFHIAISPQTVVFKFQILENSYIFVILYMEVEEF